MSRIVAQPGTIIVTKKNFGDLTARGFTMRVRGKSVEGFVVRKGDRYYAYENVCQHLAVTLDLKDENFFTHDKRHLQCQMHGAIYEIETGLCTEGPCQGARLVSLPLREEEDQIVITFAEKDRK